MCWICDLDSPEDVLLTELDGVWYDVVFSDEEDLSDTDDDDKSSVGSPATRSSV